MQNGFRAVKIGIRLSRNKIRVLKILKFFLLVTNSTLIPHKEAFVIYCENRKTGDVVEKKHLGWGRKYVGECRIFSQ